VQLGECRVALRTPPTQPFDPSPGTLIATSGRGWAVRRTHRRWLHLISRRWLPAIA